MTDAIAPARLRVLLVDDDRPMRTALARLLEHAGFSPMTAGTVEEARKLLAAETIDVVVSDINMPGSSGLQFLAEVRERDPGLPFVLMTAAPQLESAVMAVNLGAFRYLMKPVDLAELEATIRKAGLARSFARLQREALDAVRSEDAARANANRMVDDALSGLWMAWQPIVKNHGSALFAYEALLRTDEPLLSRPEEFVGTAQQVERGRELARAVRARVAQTIPTLPDGTLALVNIVAEDLSDPDLVNPDAPLSAHAPRVVLEITERTKLDATLNIPSRVKQLRDLGFRLAVDDLGAGYSGLSSITQLEPSIVKLDMSLIRDIHESMARRAVVASMVILCQSMHIEVIAEGIEKREEADVLWDLGVDLCQGYLFGRPGREPRWTPRSS
jgi:EAL domain-containing protein (putative c-di-GMP-specific phosphodiesterase class I)